MQDPDFISLFVSPLDIAGMIEQQDLDQEFLDTSIRTLHLETQWQAAKDQIK